MLSDEVDSFRVLGVDISLVEMTGVLDILDEWIISKDKYRYVVATGMHGVMQCRKQSNFKKVLQSAALLVPDGYSLVKIAKLRGLFLKHRVSGPDLMREACVRAAEKGHTVFFYGDTLETLEQLVFQLNISLPDLKIAGYHSPPFRPLTPDEDAEEIRVINASGADIIWVGLGLPKQEQWMFEHSSDLNPSVAIGVGAAFKFMSGRVRRAPRWVGENGFEWLWRFMIEPRRVWRRVLIDGPLFYILAILETLSLKRSRLIK